MKDLNLFFKQMHLRVHNKEVYETAFTHSSYNFDANTSHKDYERLEFMGDSIINFVVAELAFKIRTDLNQGEMTKLRSNLVQSEALKRMALEYHLDEYVRVGKSLQNKNLEELPHILEDVFEAVIGAIFIDQGLNKTYKMVKKLFYNEVKYFSFDQLHDYKSKLQELFQADNRKSVEYKIIEEFGPPHDKTFTAEVLFNDIVLGKGEGKSKKEAEQEAAKDALDKCAN